jgi:hypothetical protein
MINTDIAPTKTVWWCYLYLSFFKLPGMQYVFSIVSYLLVDWVAPWPHGQVRLGLSNSALSGYVGYVACKHTIRWFLGVTDLMVKSQRHAELWPQNVGASAPVLAVECPDMLSALDVIETLTSGRSPQFCRMLGKHVGMSFVPASHVSAWLATQVQISKLEMHRQFLTCRCVF